MDISNIDVGKTYWLVIPGNTEVMHVMCDGVETHEFGTGAFTFTQKDCEIELHDYQYGECAVWIPPSASFFINNPDYMYDENDRENAELRARFIYDNWVKDYESEITDVESLMSFPLKNDIFRNRAAKDAYIHKQYEFKQKCFENMR